MRISCLQMNMLEGEPGHNMIRAEALVREAARRDAPDVMVLPETWNTGFAPANLATDCADAEGRDTKKVFSALAKELSVNIVAGSVMLRRDDGIHNTSFVFDRSGECIASYDKTHLFSPMKENEHCVAGKALTNFSLDGVPCGVIICYDLRFPELIRSLALKGMDVLFMVSQWPAVRAEHLSVLTRARAIENQCFVAVTNSCGQAGGTQYGGGSAIIDPLGNVMKKAGEGEEILTADVDTEGLRAIRTAIPVYRDRRPELYSI